MRPEDSLTLEGDNLIRVSGRLDVSTVAGFKEEGIGLIDQVDDPVFDLGGAEVAGSAVIALLIAWQRHAEASDKQVRFDNAPGNLLDIARACGVSEFIPLSAARAEA